MQSAKDCSSSSSAPFIDEEPDVSGAETASAIGDVAGAVASAAPGAVSQSKALVLDVSGVLIDKDLTQETSKRIAARRVSDEGKEGIEAFLDKRPPSWGR